NNLGFLGGKLFHVHQRVRGGLAGFFVRVSASQQRIEFWLRGGRRRRQLFDGGANHANDQVQHDQGQQQPEADILGQRHKLGVFIEDGFFIAKVDIAEWNVDDRDGVAAVRVQTDGLCYQSPD